MANQGFLVPPTENPSHSTLWEETSERLDKFLPGMFQELFPATNTSEPQPVASVAVSIPKISMMEGKREESVAMPAAESIQE